MYYTLYTGITLICYDCIFPVPVRAELIGGRRAVLGGGLEDLPHRGGPGSRQTGKYCTFCIHIVHTVCIDIVRTVCIDIVRTVCIDIVRTALTVYILSALTLY